MNNLFQIKRVKFCIRNHSDANIVGFFNFVNDKINITANEILESDLSIENKINILLQDLGTKKYNDNIAELSFNERKEILIKLCEIIIPKFKEYYPNNLSLEDCLKAYKDLLENKITIDEYSIFEKLSYKTCSQSQIDDEYGIAYHIAYAIYAINRPINADNGDGLSEIIHILKIFKEYELKSIVVLKELFNSKPVDNIIDDTISIDSVLADIYDNNINRQKMFDVLDNVSKCIVFTTLYDMLYEYDTPFLYERNENALSFIENNKPFILNNFKSIVGEEDFI